MEPMRWTGFEKLLSMFLMAYEMKSSQLLQATSDIEVGA